MIGIDDLVVSALESSGIDTSKITVGPVPERYRLTDEEREALRSEMSFRTNQNRIARGESTMFSHL